MAWDFQTDPEFQRKLDWMRAFIDHQLIPLEPVLKELPKDEWRVVKRHLQDQVRAQGLWGAFLDPELGGAGFGQMKLALMSELIGRSMYSMTIFGVQAPDSGNMELLAHGGTDEQKARWLVPNLRGDISSAFALTEPFLAGADPTRIATTAVLDGEEWVLDGHKWFVSNGSVADIILVFAETDASNRPHRHASIFIVPAGTPGMEIQRDIPTMAHPEVEFGEPGNHAPRSCSAGAGCRPITSSVGPVTVSCSPKSDSAEGASTTRCGGSVRPRGRSTSCASALCRASRTAGFSVSTR